MISDCVIKRLAITNWHTLHHLPDTICQSKMFRLHQSYFFVILFVIYSIDNVSPFVNKNINICESEIKLCLCRYDHDSELDFSLLNLDCSISSTVFQNNSYSLPKQVHSLTVSLKSLNKIFKNNLLQSRTMEKLILNHNNISSIEVDSFDLPNLIYVDLSYNALKFIDPEIFKNVKKLKYLNLASNKFMLFSNMQFHYLSNLEEIILDGNKIGESLRESSLTHRHGLAITEGLKRLSLANIALSYIHDNLFTNLYDLRYLKISNNSIESLPELPFTLEYLDASDNPISEVYFEDFSNLLALKVLRLNNVQIREVSEFVFEPLKNLQVLDLERNALLTRFSELAFGRAVLDDAVDFTLETMSLKGSRLTTLSKGLEIPLGQLSKLDLQGNKWTCDCNLVWLKQLQIQPQDYQYLRCYLPPNLYNTKLMEVKEKYFKCGNERGFPLASIAIVSFCLILAIMAIWFFVFLPKYQSRGSTVQSVVYPTAAYTPLPINLGARFD